MADEHGLADRLTEQIKRLLESVWDHRADLQDIDEWLGQFADHDDPEQSERFQMLFLLSQFMYFGPIEVRSLLRALYRDHFQYPIIARFRRANGDTIDRERIMLAFREELARTRFVGLGNPSESSAHLLYFFRQENQLGKDQFVGTGDIFHFVAADDGFIQVVRDPDIVNYILIDDLCGSGDQVEKYAEDVALPLKAFAARAGRDVHVSYFALFGTSEGIQHVRELEAFDRVECVVELDPTFRCFSQQSRYYANELRPISQDLAQRVAQDHGARLQPDHPLGFDNGQLLIGFGHNTPDNTLPIFSFDEPTGPPWIPIFKRYAKVGG